MLTPSWRTVGTGLRLVLIGAQVVGWSIAAAFAVGCGGLALLSSLQSPEIAGWAAIGFVYTACGAVIVGRLLCTVGRWLCMATPPDATTTRARIRLAVIFEACSLLGCVAYIIISCFWTLVPLEVGMSSFGFWVLTAVLGRVCFFWFARAAGEAVKARTATADATRAYQLSLAAIASLVIGVLLTCLSAVINGDDMVVAVRVLLGVIGCAMLAFTIGVVLFLFASHLILLADLRRALAAYTPTPSDADPDAAYRDCYLAGGGSAEGA